MMSDLGKSTEPSLNQDEVRTLTSKEDEAMTVTNEDDELKTLTKADGARTLTSKECEVKTVTKEDEAMTVTNEEDDLKTLTKEDGARTVTNEEDELKTLTKEDGARTSTSKECEVKTVTKEDEAMTVTNEEDEVKAISKADDVETVLQTDNVTSSNTMDPSTLSYEGDVCIYTDPSSKHQYVWDKEKNAWSSRTSSSVTYEGGTATYTDPSDGTPYFWDEEKKAWFPKLDETFLAQYQMSYGFTDPKIEAERAEREEQAKQEKEKALLEANLKKKAPPPDPTWFEIEEQHNTKVYVSNLPLDITETEFTDIMGKCGMVMRDEVTNKMKVKLYTEAGDSKTLKGDGLCTYIKVESVDLALNLLHGYELRGNKLCVERAKFQMKGNYDPNLKPKKRRRKDRDKAKKQQEALFDWRPERMRGERAKHERTVIIKNLFDVKMFEKEVSLIKEYQEDLREECTKCGRVKKVVIYDRHVDGVAQVTFSDPEEADLCIKLLEGRWFGQRRITAETWDGKTKYKVMETEEERKARMAIWNKYVEPEEREGTSSKTDATDVVN